MLEHCREALRHEQEETRYRAYLTDALMAIAENTCNITGSGSTMTRRWYQGDEKPKDERDGDEIAQDIINRLGLTYRPKEVK